MEFVLHSVLKNHPVRRTAHTHIGNGAAAATTATLAACLLDALELSSIANIGWCLIFTYSDIYRIHTPRHTHRFSLGIWRCEGAWKLEKRERENDYDFIILIENWAESTTRSGIRIFRSTYGIYILFAHFGAHRSWCSYFFFQTQTFSSASQCEIEMYILCS